MLPCIFLSQRTRQVADIGVSVPPGEEPSPEEVCPICLELLSVDEANSGPETPYWRRACPNHHVYHQGCLRQQISYGNRDTRCPECRQDMLGSLLDELRSKHATLVMIEANAANQRAFEQREQDRLRALEAERERRRRARAYRLAREQDERIRKAERERVFRVRIDIDPVLRAMRDAGREERRRRERREGSSSNS